MKTNQQIEMEKVDISRINPAPYNPRKDLQPGDAEYEALQRSMKEFGYISPVVWNRRSGNLVGGHQRYKILKAEGHTEIMVSVVDLPLDKEKALNIALNKISGDWDQDKLAQIIQELSVIPDMDISLTGFDEAEITSLLDGLSENTPEETFDAQSELEAIKTPITQPGDLIELGEHRILCGDASSSEDIRKLMKDEKAALLNTDPPYNVDYQGTVSNKEHNRWTTIQGDNLSQEEYEQWLKKVFINVYPFFGEGMPFYLWNSHKQFGPMHQMLTDLGMHISSVITWAKENFTLGFSDYHQQTEFCLYGWKKDKNSVHLWYGSKKESTLWQVKRDPTKTYQHPTQKPLELAQRAIKNSSLRGDIVLDLFLGSGSTLIASEMLSRRCFGLEIDPRYCDVIVRRYIAYVGKNSSKVPEAVKEKYLRQEEVKS